MIQKNIRIKGERKMFNMRNVAKILILCFVFMGFAQSQANAKSNTKGTIKSSVKVARKRKKGIVKDILDKITPKPKPEVSFPLASRG